MGFFTFWKASTCKTGLQMASKRAQIQRNKMIKSGKVCVKVILERAVLSSFGVAGTS